MASNMIDIYVAWCAANGVSLVDLELVAIHISARGTYLSSDWFLEVCVQFS